MFRLAALCLLATGAMIPIVDGQRPRPLLNAYGDWASAGSRPPTDGPQPSDRKYIPNSEFREIAAHTSSSKANANSRASLYDNLAKAAGQGRAGADNGGQQKQRQQQQQQQRRQSKNQRTESASGPRRAAGGANPSRRNSAAPSYMQAARGKK